MPPKPAAAAAATASTAKRRRQSFEASSPSESSGNGVVASSSSDDTTITLQTMEQNSAPTPMQTAMKALVQQLKLDDDVINIGDRILQSTDVKTCADPHQHIDEINSASLAGVIWITDFIGRLSMQNEIANDPDRELLLTQILTITKTKVSSLIKFLDHYISLHLNNLQFHPNVIASLSAYLKNFKKFLLEALAIYKKYDKLMNELRNTIVRAVNLVAHQFPDYSMENLYGGGWLLYITSKHEFIGHTDLYQMYISLLSVLRLIVASCISIQDSSKDAMNVAADIISTIASDNVQRNSSLLEQLEQLHIDSFQPFLTEVNFLPHIL